MKLIACLSEYLVPLVLFYIVGFAVLQKRPVFDDFIEGAKQGMKTVAGILPTLIGLMTAVGILRASGFFIRCSGRAGRIISCSGGGGSGDSGAPGIQFGGCGTSFGYF